MAVKASYIITLVRVDNGATGDTGNGVKSIDTEFYLSTSKTTQTNGSWSTTQPTWSHGKYVWTRNKITYTNGSTSYTTPQCSSEWEAVNNLQIGGRNLFINSGNLSEAFYGTLINKVDADAGAKMIRSFGTDENVPSKNYVQFAITGNPALYFGPYIAGNNYLNSIKKGDTVTVSIWQKYSRDINIPMNCDAEFLTSVKIISQPILNSTWQKMSITGTAVRDVISKNGAIAITFYYNTNFKDGDILYLSSPKVEFGNKATDWTPAQEDMATAEQVQNAKDAANSAQSTADDANSRVSVAESTIKQISDSISMLVTDNNGSSMMTQTSDGWTFNIGAITSAIDSASNNIDNLTSSLSKANNTINNLNNLANDLSKKTSYINMITDDTGAPCIELGKVGNDFKVRITNTSVDFIQGSSKIAYVSNQALFIEKAIIKNELQIGEKQGFVWKTRSNSNLGLRWFG